MCDKHRTTIGKFVNGNRKGGDEMQLISAEIPTAGGIQGVALLNEEQILEVVVRYRP